jgi:hypothetical protein
MTQPEPIRRAAAWLRHFLVAGPGPMWAWVLKAWVLGTSTAILVVAAVYGVIDALGVDPASGAAPSRDPLQWHEWLGSVVIAPVLETGILLLMLKGARALGLSLVVRVVLMGLVWGGLHALLGWRWFFGPAVLFMLYAAGAEAWRDRGRWAAFTVACVPHALNNATVMVVLATATGDAVTSV